MRRHRPLPTRPVVLAAALLLALSACAGAPDEKDSAATEDPDFPVEITACGHTSTLVDAPERAVTLNQGATEVMLALGLEDRMAGTAYLDDPEPPEQWRAAYESVPVLSDEYPTREALLDVEPDFVYASYGSGFDGKVAGAQDELEQTGIASYLSPFGCDDESLRPDASFDAAWAEIEAIGDAFGEADAAAALIDGQEAELADLSEQKPGEGVDVFWYDSGDKTPFVGVGGGGPQLVLDAIGATNVFADVDGGWTEVGWERVLEADPDVIVLADASWSTAAEKIAYLVGDPVLSQLRAVQDQAFVTVPFAESTPGVRLVDGATSVAEQLGQLSS